MSETPKSNPDTGVGFPQHTQRTPEQPVLFELVLRTGERVRAIVEEAEEHHLDGRKWVNVEDGELIPSRTVAAWREI
jgi:hypothetical protein